MRHIWAESEGFLGGLYLEVPMKNVILEKAGIQIRNLRF
jgi:hypothetical protein